MQQIDPIAAPAASPSRRTAQFGLALITLILTGCFGLLIANSHGRPDSEGQTRTPAVQQSDQ